ncbi:host-nuclease inhibitor Gam family protein, partial [Dysgonomonas sp. ZJ279]|uniref:host-nuclease inhibitor Gam family protein n=1 Tax=Dysgonomonas sp. ZJ279 TaxID=2709796 RepID=UPI002103011A
MTAKREKHKVQVNISIEVMQEALNSYAISDAQIVKLNADLDLKIAKLREARADELARFEKEKTESFGIVQAYALENKATQFSKKKSIEYAHGVIGFRNGTPKLKTKKGFTWAAVTKLLAEFLPNYVRKTEEPAKDMLLAD